MNPFPTFGPLVRDGKLHFSFFSASAHQVKLLLFDPKESIPSKILPLHKTAPGIWHAETPLPSPSTEYMYEVDDKIVLDPYAKALSTPHTWGIWQHKPRCQFIFDHKFDWEGVKKPGYTKEELVIYEAHVRGFTQDKSSLCKYPGTYLGMIEKIPYLKKLGINAIELLPVYEFDERDNARKEPSTGKRLWNYWGYMTLNFFTPMKRYSTSHDRLSALREFKMLVKEFHKAGIEVILDVVYNHVAPASDLDKIDKKSYFILTDKKEHTNFSGCGNTLSTNYFASSHLTLASLRFF